MSQVFEIGVYENGVFEGGEAIIQDASVVANISRSFVLDGVDITASVKSATLNRAVGKPYHTLSISTVPEFTLSETMVRNPLKRLVATIGADVYSTIIIDADYNYRGEYDIVSRTEGCLLDFPFSPKYNRRHGGSSHDIIAALAAEVGITILATSAVFYLNKGDMELEGTALDVLNAVANATGADIVEAYGNIIIKPSMRIPSGSSQAATINTNITSLDMSDNQDGSTKVRRVVINPYVGEIYSEPKITMCIDTDLECPKPYFLFNPTPISASQITANIGTFSLTQKSEVFSGTMQNERIFKVDGGIDSINYVTIDGAPTTAYQFEAGNNVIVFNSVVSGGVIVSYQTTAVQWYSARGFQDYRNKKSIYRLSYLGEALEESLEFCSTSTGSDGSEVSHETNDGCSVRVDQDPTKSAPFSFYTNGTLKSMIWIVDDSATPTFINNYAGVAHYRAGGTSDDTAFLNNNSGGSNILTYSETEQATQTFKVERIDPFKYGGRLAKSISPISYTIGVRSVAFSVDTTHSDYNTHHINSSVELGKTVTAAYQRAVTKFEVPIIGGTSNIKAFEINACDGIVSVEFPDEDKGEYESCELPTERQIDVAGLLSVSVAASAGKVVTSATLTGSPYTVDNEGKILVNITTPQYHIIDCDTVKKNAEIYIDSRDAEVTV